MSEENVEYEEADTAVQDAPENAPQEEKAEKPKRKRKKNSGPKKPRTPQVKDWLRVQFSQGNGQPNQTIHLVYNEATQMCELHTQAKRFADDAPDITDEQRAELENARVQVFKVTSFEMVNEPDRDPTKSNEPAPAETNEG